MLITFENLSGDNIPSSIRHIMEPTIIEIKKNDLIYLKYFYCNAYKFVNILN